MRDEGIELFEALGIEEERDSLARSQLARVALTLQPLFPTAERSPALKLFEA